MEYNDLKIHEYALNILCNLSYIKTVEKVENSMYNNVIYTWAFNKDKIDYKLLYKKTSNNAKFELNSSTESEKDVDIDKFIKENRKILEKECDKLPNHKEILTKLFDMPYNTIQANKTTIYNWKFFKDEEEYLIEYRKNIIYFTNNLGMYRDCVRNFTVIQGIGKNKQFHTIENVKELDQYFDDLEKRNTNIKTNKTIIDNITRIYGPYDARIMYEMGWMIKSKQLKVHFFINTLKDLSKKQIQLRYDTKGEWETKLVSIKQLMNFLKKYDKLLKEPVIEEPKVNKLIRKIEEITLDETVDLTAKSNARKIPKECNLFINYPKKKRISIQTCKDEEDKYAYLLKDLHI